MVPIAKHIDIFYKKTDFSCLFALIFFRTVTHSEVLIFFMLDIFSYSFKRDWKEAYGYARKLLKESRWSAVGFCVNFDDVVA